MGNLTAKTSGDIASFMTPTETNITSLKVHFSPKQLGEGDPSPDNVREIVGRESVEIYHTGKNIYSYDGAQQRCYLYLKEGDILTASNKIGGKFYCYDNNLNQLSSVTLVRPEGEARWRGTLSVPKNTGYVYFNRLGGGLGHYQVEFGSEATDLEPYKGETLSINWKGLPDEYQEVEYIESTGFSWLETSIDIKKDDIVSSKLIFQNTSSYTNNVWFAGDGSQRDGIQHEYGLYGARVGYLDGDKTKYQYGEDRHFSKTEACFLDRTYGSNVTLFWRVFGRYGFDMATEANCPPCKIWYNSFTINGNKVLEFIPCYRKSDGEIGMYDLVSQTFYTNQGTGTFLKGDDVFSETVYGGYVDLISGELVQEWNMIIADSSDAPLMNYGPDMYQGTEGTNRGFLLPQDKCVDAMSPSNAFGKVFSDKVNFAYTGIWAKPNDNIWKTCINNKRQWHIVFDNDVVGITSDMDWAQRGAAIKAWVKENPITLVYKLETPTTHQLTPQQLQSFIGQNNFWSNADYVEIEYDLIETVDIQKARQKIILNQPHIESIKDDLVNFNTDLRAPLKECKVYFGPMQEGEGDPSPENVRNIIGWDGIEIIKTRKNLIDPNKMFQTSNYSVSDNIITVLNADQTGWLTKSVLSLKAGTYTFSRSNGYGRWYYTLDTAPNTQLTLLNVNQTSRTLTFDTDVGLRFKIGNFADNYPFTVTVQCELNSTETEYEVYQGTTLTSDWSSDIGTVYGGYVDLVKGELVATYKKTIIDGSFNAGIFPWGQDIVDINTGKTITKALYLKRDTGDNKRNRYATFYCNKLKNISNYGIKEVGCSIYDGDSYSVTLTLPKEDVGDTQETLKTYLNNNPIEVVFELAEPIHYQLTPQQLLTFKGTNNIWSNSNGQIETKYWKH